MEIVPMRDTGPVFDGNFGESLMAKDSERRTMEKAMTAIALIILGTIIVAYGKDLILSGKHMLSA